MSFIIPFCFMPYIRPLLSFAFTNAALAATYLENTSSLAVDGASLVAPSGKEPSCQCRRCWRHGFNPWVERILDGDRKTHSSILIWKNPMDRGVWRAIVHEITKSQIRLSDLPCTQAVDTVILMASMDDHQHSLYWREWGR